MYNACFGGFGFSQLAIKLYNQRRPENSPKLTDDDCFACGREIDRADPIMVQVVRELGPSASNTYSRVMIEEIPEKFKDHYSIQEYDGNESVQIEHDRYTLHRIEGIMRDAGLGEADKIERALREIDELREWAGSRELFHE